MINIEINLPEITRHNIDLSKSLPNLDNKMVEIQHNITFTSTSLHECIRMQCKCLLSAYPTRYGAASFDAVPVRS